jgi:hypothetical protein
LRPPSVMTIYGHNAVPSINIRLKYAFKCNKPGPPNSAADRLPTVFLEHKIRLSTDRPKN